jgi:hypothetical protein
VYSDGVESGGPQPAIPVIRSIDDHVLKFNGYLQSCTFIIATSISSTEQLGVYTNLILQQRHTVDDERDWLSEDCFLP